MNSRSMHNFFGRLISLMSLIFSPLSGVKQSVSIKIAVRYNLRARCFVLVDYVSRLLERGFTSDMAKLGPARGPCIAFPRTIRELTDRAIEYANKPLHRHIRLAINRRIVRGKEVPRR